VVEIVAREVGVGGFRVRGGDFLTEGGGAGRGFVAGGFEEGGEVAVAVVEGVIVVVVVVLVLRRDRAGVRTVEWRRRAEVGFWRWGTAGVVGLGRLL
jgi:hypothetical protein